GIKPEDGLRILEIIESFLVRRAICGHEPTGLHAVFKRLWQDCEGTPTPERVNESIRKHKTVVWPTERDVIDAVCKRPLYGSTITKYVLLEYDRSLGGDKPLNDPWIEHVLPDTPSEDWFDSFSKQQHLDTKDLLANLIPLTQEMNTGLGNKSYSSK